jgi:hypothetical protein
MSRIVVLCAVLALAGLVSIPALAQPVPAVNSSLGCTAGQIAGNVAGALGCVDAASVKLTAKAFAIGSTGDKATLSIPAGVTKYGVSKVAVYNCTVVPVLAQIALWTGAAGTGTAVVAASTITGATSASAIVLPTVAAPLVTLTASSLFLNVAIANLAAGTCDATIMLDNYS